MIRYLHFYWCTMQQLKAKRNSLKQMLAKLMETYGFVYLKIRLKIEKNFVSLHKRN